MIKTSQRLIKIRFARAMMNRGCTAKELSVEVGVSISAIEKFRTGHLRPSTETAAKIEKVLRARIFSTLTGYKCRQNELALADLARLISETEGCDLPVAFAMAQKRFSAAPQ
jgi:transcriptional regulator with XRE-family HTH domain